MLTPDSVIDYLVNRGILPHDGTATARPLLGGVSNEVLAVSGDGIDVVVKQALSQLRVEQEWLADPTRVLVEADALRIAARYVPEAVPAVVDADPQQLTLTVARAPRHWADWKTQLMQGTAEPAVARLLGSTLACWHSATAARDDLPERFGTSHFEQLRIGPYYQAAAARHPDLAVTVNEFADALLADRSCLVHGDFSPKNILTDGHSAWVIDWEVAHYGSPVFDLAFLHTHLLLKAVHQPEHAAAYEQCAQAFGTSYAQTTRLPPIQPAQLAGQVGCLLLARADGKSPAEYLDPRGRQRTRALARAALTQSADLNDLWKTLT
ncbi:phosphotransferase family protein [Streptomyces sp. NPDC056227]|uniref:phosphotransferase family protein n=1 Tax=Streptomyces sp. NPDC056227 TaxID=3345753 RepID=UPI0035D6E136